MVSSADLTLFIIAHIPCYRSPPGVEVVVFRFAEQVGNGYKTTVVSSGHLWNSRSPLSPTSLVIAYPFCCSGFGAKPVGLLFLIVFCRICEDDTEEVAVPPPGRVATETAHPRPLCRCVIPPMDPGSGWGGSRGRAPSPNLRQQMYCSLFLVFFRFFADLYFLWFTP